MFLINPTGCHEVTTDIRHDAPNRLAYKVAIRCRVSNRYVQGRSPTPTSTVHTRDRLRTATPNRILTAGSLQTRGRSGINDAESLSVVCACCTTCMLQLLARPARRLVWPARGPAVIQRRRTACMYRSRLNMTQSVNCMYVCLFPCCALEPKSS